MKIAIISSVYEQTPPLKYGGIERVLDFLVKGLKTKGHDVTLFATGDSNSPCELVHFFEHPVTSYDLKAQVIHSQKACRYINEHNFDIVQNNIDISVGLKDLLKVPMVHTLHMDVLNKNKQFIFNHFKDANYVAISDKQRENAESYGLNVISRIYNGLDVENYSPALKRGKYLAYLGNFAPFKGPHIAIEVAQKTGIPLKLAGKVNAMGKEYFEKDKTSNNENFPGYDEKLKKAWMSTGMNEAVICGVGKINQSRVVLCVMDSRFMMGSMGKVVGEKICKAVELATRKKLPLIISCTSGGARMQEGIDSLMQMAKISAALKRFSNQGGLYIALLTHPTTGGVSASFAMLGDIIIAEPQAMIGFAGKRVIQDTIKQELPEGFQTAEFLLEKGFIDMIVERHDLKNVISDLLKLHGGKL